MRRSAAIYSLVAIECIIWVTLIASPSADATPIGERWVGDVATADAKPLAQQSLAATDDDASAHGKPPAHIESQARALAVQHAPTERTQAPPLTGCKTVASASSASLKRCAPDTTTLVHLDASVRQLALPPYEFFSRFCSAGMTHHRKGQKSPSRASMPKKSRRPGASASTWRSRHRLRPSPCFCICAVFSCCF